MNATLFFYGPFKQRLDWAGASLLCDSFPSVVQAREWAWANDVRFFDARFRRISQKEGDLVWQVVASLSPRPLPERLAHDYVGVAEKADTPRDVAARRCAWAKKTMRDLLGGKDEGEDWRSPHYTLGTSWGHVCA